MNAALAPRSRAVQQLVDALESQLQSAEPNQAHEAAVAAATAHWEKVCGGPMDAATLDLMREEASAQAAKKANRPPAMSSVLSATPEMTDVGYGLGLYLDGLEGTWHRLWALMSLTIQFGDDPDVDAGCAEVRQQFEKILGRVLTPQEWSSLNDHARRHAQASPFRI